MCEYSCGTDGLATPWHMVHLGSKAAGGTGLVMAEATAVSPVGRLSPSCAGIWSGAHVDAWRPVTDFITSQGSVPAIQIAHGGRKGSYTEPWNTPKRNLDESENGWQIVGPSAIPFDESFGTPKELTTQEIAEITQQFVDGALYSLEAGFKVIELHFAHGYLASSFMSPLSNTRTDEYGGSLENRSRFALETIKAIRKAIPESAPLLVRISSSEFVENGWDIDDSVQLAKWMKDAGVDLIDASAGGNNAKQVLKLSPGYQVPFSDAIRNQAGIMTGAVGLITDAQQAEDILQAGQADAVFIGREIMRNPYWSLYAQAKLDGKSENWPVQYKPASMDFSYTGPTND
jgi:2,4-dienoyl-CoA reductase-like NADH-dependent reductase (Old Yellow Enzyme family)